MAADEMKQPIGLSIRDSRSDIIPSSSLGDLGTGIGGSEHSMENISKPRWGLPDGHLRKEHVSLDAQVLDAAIELLGNRENTHTETIKARIESIVAFHADDEANGCLVLEGSALWPQSVVTGTLNRTAAIWLTAGDGLFQARIYRDSQIKSKTGPEKQMIEKFLARTIVYNCQMMAAVEQLGLPWLNVESARSLDDLVKLCLAAIRPVS